MKLLHISDLHLGIRLGEYSLEEEQQHILQAILDIVDAERPDAVLIAGDVYDRSLPPEEAVRLFDAFLYGLASRRTETFVISGNHDSAERIAFGGRIMELGGVHLSPVYDGHASHVTMQDEHGEVTIWMLPFIKPVHVRRFFPDAAIQSYNDALRTAVEAMQIDPAGRNVLMTHQFITGAVRTDSEAVCVGGTENVDAALFRDFDYVALGHIHKPQRITDAMYYCGTPLKYSLSEAEQEKSVIIAELGAKGELAVRQIPLTPLRDVRAYRSTFDELMSSSFYSTIHTDDYVYLTLTDADIIPDAVLKLRKVYPHLVKLSYDNRLTNGTAHLLERSQAEELSPGELFGRFYREYDHDGLNAQQQAYLDRIISEIWEEESV